MFASSARSTENIPQVAFTTLGCPKNEVDTDLMRRTVEQAGYRTCEYFAEKPQQVSAVVVNTCSFIQEATEASIEAIFDALEVLDRGAADRPAVIVAGCIVNRYVDDLSSELPEVAAFIKVGDTDGLVDALRKCLPPGSPVPLERTADQARSYEYLRIADGCDRKCTFCTIPGIRGPYTSRKPEDIIAQAQALIDAGTKELIVIAQDIGRYGSDFEAIDGKIAPSELLVDLLEELALLPGLKRLRLMYLQPEGLTDELLDVMARCPAIVPYLEVPLQHVAPRILKAMGRNPRDVASFTVQLEKARTLMPDLAVRTTLIAGFPGETGEEFAQLCNFVEDCSFDYVGVFPYSAEEGTRAAELPNQLDETVRLERAQTIRDLADRIGWSRMSERIGQFDEVLIEGLDEDENVLIARASFQAPDIDGIVRVAPPVFEGATSVKVDYSQNSYLRVEFADAILYDMEAQVSVRETSSGERGEIDV